MQRQTEGRRAQVSVNKINDAKCAIGCWVTIFAGEVFPVTFSRLGYVSHSLRVIAQLSAEGERLLPRLTLRLA